MRRHATILGLGDRGTSWAQTFVDAGWQVSAFDPDPDAFHALPRSVGVRREATISAAVRQADCILCCLPERLELIQMVMRRALAEAPANVALAIASRAHDVDTLQCCTIRPAQVVRLDETEEGGVILDLSGINTPEIKETAERTFAELAAIRSLRPADVQLDRPEGAKSA